MSRSVERLVLLVDDDVNLLRGVARLLRHQPFRLLTAHSADEAREILKRWPIDVLICDQHMPGLRGTDLLAWVARNSPRTVRILLTGQPDLPSAIEAINEGRVFRFLTKPCHDWDLISVIHDALDVVEKCGSTPP